jgi:hypothetical protein
MMLILLCMCMYRIAELDKRRGWVWASITFFLIVLLQSVLGVVLTFILMILANIYRPVNKGPFL